MACGPRAYGGQVGGGIFALRRPRPYSRHCGAYCHRPSYTPHGHQRAWREGEETTRRAASLRPPRNGRIGFKPPYSQKGPCPYGRLGIDTRVVATEGRGGLCSDVACRVASKKTRCFGDRDAARHVATKTRRRPRSAYVRRAKNAPAQASQNGPRAAWAQARGLFPIPAPRGALPSRRETGPGLAGVPIVVPHKSYTIWQ